MGKGELGDHLHRDVKDSEIKGLPKSLLRPASGDSAHWTHLYSQTDFLPVGFLDSFKVHEVAT